MPDIHLRLSPSGASRWLKCPGSAVAGLGDDPSEAADRGTHLHDTAYSVLVSNVDKCQIKDDPDGEEIVHTYVEYVRGLPAFGTQHIQFERFTESKLIPEFGGTMDCVTFAPEELHVVDLKTGRWPVTAEDNKQLLSYLCLAREVFGPRPKYVASIVQPVLSKHASVSEYTDADLDAHLAAVQRAATDNTLRAGEHCKWCPLLATCQTSKQWLLTQARVAFDDNPTTAEALELLEAETVITELAKQCRVILLGRALSGQQVPGYKVVQTFGHRKWRDATDTVELLCLITGVPAEQLYEDPKLKSPAQVEKLLPKQDRHLLGELAEKPANGPALVPLTSRGVEYKPVDAFVFDEVNQ